MAQSHSHSQAWRLHTFTPAVGPLFTASSISSFYWNIPISEQMLSYLSLKKQTLVSPFPTIALFLSASLLSKTLYSPSPVPLPSSDHLPLCESGTDLAPPLMYNLDGTWHLLYHLSLGLWPSIAKRDRKSQFCHSDMLLWKSTNSGKQLDAMSFFSLPSRSLFSFLPLYLNFSHRLIVLNAFQHRGLLGHVLKLKCLQYSGSCCEWTRL